MMGNKATINIDASLHKMLKIEAAKSDLKISELAESLLKEGLTKKQNYEENKLKGE